MTIAIFNWRDIKNPKAGGAEIVTHEYAKGWVKAGHRVLVLCPAFPGSLPEESIDGVKYIRIGFPIHLTAFFYYQKYLKNKIDLIVDEIHGLPFFTPFYVKEKKLAFICEVAGKIWFEMYPFPIAVVGWLVETLYFRFYKNTDFLTISQSTKEDLLKKGIAEKNITVVYPGLKINKHKIYPKEKIPTLLYLNRICKMKNLKDAIRASAKIKNCGLWIAGHISDEKYYQECLSLIDKLKLKNVKFFGYVDEAKKYELLSKAHILIHTSVKEGWGMNILEANSCGTPAVGYDVAGLRETIKNEVTGLITSKNNPYELANLIRKLLSNKLKYKLMTKACKNWSKNFEQ